MAETKQEFSQTELIKTFKETYNATYLGTLSRDKIRELKRTVNPILQKLIDNFLTTHPKTYMTEMIEGPKSFYKLKLDKKSFYIFGENHNINPVGNCLPAESLEFAEYIRRLSEETPSFFDLYIEFPMLRSTKPQTAEEKGHYDLLEGSPYSALSETVYSMIVNPLIDFNIFFEINRKMYTKDDKKIGSYVLESIIDNFEDCFQPSTRKNSDKCQLMRIHNVDARHSWLSEELYDDFYLHMASLILRDAWHYDCDNQTKIGLLRRINRDKAVEVISSLFDFENDQVNIVRLDEVLLSNKYIQKEIDRVESPMKEAILNFYKQKIHSLLSAEVVLNLKELIYCLQGTMAVPELNTYFKPMSRFLLYMLAYGMDMYCMARVFKKYNVLDTFQPVESKNVIIYTGLAHSKSYREFLNSIGGVTSYYSENTKGCVKVIKRSIMVQMKIEDTSEYFESLRIKAESKNRFKIIDDDTFRELNILITFEAQNLLSEIKFDTALSDNQAISNIQRLKDRISDIYFSKLKENQISELDEEEEEAYEDIRFEDEYIPQTQPQPQPQPQPQTQPKPITKSIFKFW
jgi:hypothetical protein